MTSSSKPKPQAQGPFSDLALHTIGWKAFQDMAAQICETKLGVPVTIFRESNDGGQDAVLLIPSKGDEDAKTGTAQVKHSSRPKEWRIRRYVTSQFSKSAWCFDP